MKLELTDGEVRAIGERRWLRRYWKRFVAINGGGLIIILAGLTPLSLMEVEGRELVAYPLIILWGVIYLISMLKMDKSGKNFLKEQSQ